MHSNIYKLDGPNIFLQRLLSILPSYIECENIAIVTPDYRWINKIPKDKKVLIVGRLNGAFYYKFSPKNIINFLKQRGFRIPVSLCRILSSAPDITSPVFTMPINKYLNRASQWVQRESDIIVFQSELSKKMQDRFVSTEYKKKPYRVIYNGLDTAEFSPVKKNTNLLSGNPALLISGYFRLHKRLQDAILLTNHLSKKMPEVKLNILGDMDKLTENIVRKLDLSKVVFHGSKDPGDLPSYYASADVMLSMTVFDACPNVVIEGMASGCPVITNSSSGAAELVGYKEMIVDEFINSDWMELHNDKAIPHIDITVWSEKIIYIYKNLNIFRERVRERTVDKFDIKIIANKYAEFISEHMN